MNGTVRDNAGRGRADGAGPGARPVILFVSHPEAACGVHQFGRAVADVLAASARYAFRYVECADAAAFGDAVRRHPPAAVIYNHHPGTMAWLDWRVAAGLPVRQIGILHEVTQAVADAESNAARHALFHYRIAPDPTLLLRNPIVFKTGRLIPAYARPAAPPPAVPTFGSFGFGLTGKGFDRLVRTVQAEYDRAIVRLHIPSAAFADPSGDRAAEIAAHCRSLVTKPGIQVDLSHDLLAPEKLLDFLAANTANAFFYDRYEDRGISSAIDAALAVRRPIAITRSYMFRHVWAAAPSICVEDASLRAIVANGVSPLDPFVRAWTPDHLLADYERITAAVLAAPLPRRPGPLAWFATRAKRRLRRNPAIRRVLSPFGPATADPGASAAPAPAAVAYARIAGGPRTQS